LPGKEVMCIFIVLCRKFDQNNRGLGVIPGSYRREIHQMSPGFTVEAALVDRFTMAVQFGKDVKVFSVPLGTDGLAVYLAIRL
jgi:hypothetical protein